MAGCYLPTLKFESEAAARAYDADAMADMKYRSLVARAFMRGLRLLPFDGDDGDDTEFPYDGGRLGVVR